MAKVSYVPWSQDFEDLFSFCGISLPTADFGGNMGWAADAFADAAVDAAAFLNDQIDISGDEWSDEQWETIEGWFARLENYSVFYWSTEKPIYG